MRLLLVIALAPVLAIREGHQKQEAAQLAESDSERGTSMTMMAQVMFPGNCGMFGGPERVLKVIIKDTNVPSRFEHKFEKTFSMGLPTTQTKLLEEKLEDVPDSAKLMATVYVKQQSRWKWMGWSKCGKKSAEITFPFDSNIHIQPFQKDSKNFFYQYIEVIFTKDRPAPQVIKRAGREAPKEEDQTFGRKIVDEEAGAGSEEELDDDVDTQEPPPSIQVDPPSPPREPDEEPPSSAPEAPEAPEVTEATSGDELDESDKDLDSEKSGTSKEEDMADIDTDAADTDTSGAATSSEDETTTEVVDAEEIAEKSKGNPDAQCDDCIDRLGLGLEGLKAWHVNDVVSALCSMDDCSENCKGDWEGATIGCSKDPKFYYNMKKGIVTHYVGLEMAKRKAKKAANSEEEASAKQAEMASSKATEEEDDQPNDEDPSVKAMQECQSGPHGGSWIKSQLEQIVKGKGKKKAKKDDMKKWLQGYCGKQKTSDKNFKCVGLWTKITGEVQAARRGGGSCNFDLWMKNRASDKWSADCPFNRWRICEDGNQTCSGTHLTWATCYAKMK